ncbi:MAG: hypothetical protein V1732_05400 [Patescibacteria group bacterium]|nr:hypothetical protein [Patescibacteria group bacterium]
MSPYIYIIEILQSMEAVLKDYWWFFLPNILLIIFEMAWMNYIQGKYARELKWVLLEIKTPQGIEKGPQIFEHILSGLYATEGGMIDTVFDTYLKGVVETYFSLEIAGLEGQVHFYIRAPLATKDLVEAQVYAQYPKAEIEEVEDYAETGASRFPDKNWNIWGTEMILKKEDAYPIRTYNQFQEKITNELIDPIASFIEEFSKNTPGEYTWLQILIRPAKDYWKKDAEQLIGKLIGRKEKEKKNILGDVWRDFEDIFRNIWVAPFRLPVYPEKEKSSDNDIKESLMLYLSPDAKEVVEAISNNLTKHGYETTIRWLYIGRKESFNKGKGFFSVMAPLSQFNSHSLNSFAINGFTKTSAYYIATEWRKNIKRNDLIRKYRERKIEYRGFVLNLEELATVYHLPTIGVEAPQTPWVKARRGGSPKELPVG